MLMETHLLLTGLCIRIDLSKNKYEFVGFSSVDILLVFFFFFFPFFFIERSVDRSIDLGIKIDRKRRQNKTRFAFPIE